MISVDPIRFCHMKELGCNDVEVLEDQLKYTWNDVTINFENHVTCLII